ncbi:clostripain-related cysteine peptidase [Aestuariivivens sediminicola]|uniref:clostripain-related cysteine peptidase n=1 Tax=Aestuariivivens sediminicola TaxID=2913560 RepID=UPI001F59FAA6|nr:clostripain-related cysteine peptidase [Aestuariivivens sediminicola]
MKYTLTILLTFFISISFSQSLKKWTIIYYAVGSNSSESDLLSDIAEMKKGKKSMDYNLVLLIDRVEGFSEDSITLDGNFTDTRLYQIEHNSYNRLDGKEFLPEIDAMGSYEANMADALILKKFIQYCKKYYPAQHYLLVLRSHGNGVGMCPDAESGDRDRLYPAEVTKVLSKNESVDILGLDVCSMAGLENLYQWRPENNSFSADYVIASSPLSGAWEYDQILERLVTNSSNDLELHSRSPDVESKNILNPNQMTPLAFSKMIFEEIYENQQWASWGVFDNSKINELKLIIDEASRSLVNEEKAIINNIIENTLGYYHNTSNNLEIAQLTFPYIDAYHFWSQIATNGSFSSNTQNKAKDVCELINELVIDSYYGHGFLPETENFTNGKSGVYQIIPQGTKTYSQTKNSFWSHCGWYHPDDKSSGQDSFGQYDWCINGAIKGNDQVDNFFELLDYLFDDTNDDTGGVNKYKW